MSATPLLDLPEVSKEPSASERKAVATFLRCVAQGDSDGVEALLQHQPGLVLRQGRVEDPSGRRFESITGFQYALWALDKPMWMLLLRYLPVEAAAVQYAALEQKGTAHGSYFDLKPLIQALKIYTQRYDGWCQSQAWDTMALHWRTQVGEAQRWLPAYVAQEYCHPTEHFGACPDWDRRVLVRQGYPSQADSAGLGQRYALARGWRQTVIVSEGGEEPDVVYYAQRDAAALTSLAQARQLDRERLRNRLSPKLQPKVPSLPVTHASLRAEVEAQKRAEEKERLELEALEAQHRRSELAKKRRELELKLKAAPEPPISSEALRTQGLEAERQGNFSQARTYYQQALAAGSTKALTSLGMFAWKGQGGESKDAKRAYALFKQGAEAGHDRAMYNLAYLLETGEPGVPQDLKEALRWYHTLADNASHSEGLRQKAKERIAKIQKRHGVVWAPPQQPDVGAKIKKGMVPSSSFLSS